MLLTIAVVDGFYGVAASLARRCSNVDMWSPQWSARAPLPGQTTRSLIFIYTCKCRRRNNCCHPEFKTDSILRNCLRFRRQAILRYRFIVTVWQIIKKFLSYFMTLFINFSYAFLPRSIPAIYDNFPGFRGFCY